MPSEMIHKAKLKSNYNAYKAINSNQIKFLDWESIILFYGSVHCVDMFFTSLKKPQHPTNHKERNKLVSRYLQKYASDYLYAFNISVWARYGGLPITSDMRDSCLKNYGDLSQIV